MTNERQQKIEEVLTKRQAGLAVVLENVNDPHNVSAVLRTCDAVGIQHVYILNTVIPKHKRWGPRSSSSAAKWLTVEQFTNVDECFKALRSKYNKIYTTHLAENAVSLYDLNLTEPVALVFGNEHDGCSAEVIKRADGNFIIPQFGIIQSLNISVACAVSIYEASRQRNLAGMYKNASLPTQEYNELFNYWSLSKKERVIVDGEAS
jgi:tRNA (guanosine-2'-O-)-methyltransferase